MPHVQTLSDLKRRHIWMARGVIILLMGSLWIVYTLFISQRIGCGSISQFPVGLNPESDANDIRAQLNTNIRRTLCDNNTRVLLLVPTIIFDFESRKKFRQFSGHCGQLAKSPVRVLFYAGEYIGMEKSEVRLVYEEQMRYKDLVWDSGFIEHYRNLTVKTLRSLEWSANHCPQSKIVFKVDVDVYLQLDQLFDFAMKTWSEHEQESRHSRTSNSRETAYALCHVLSDRSPIRDPQHKWYVSYDEYPHEKYPTYCGGHAYVLTRDTVSKILRNAKALDHLRKKAYKTFEIPMEDAFTTGILLENVPNLKRTHSWGFCPYACQPSDFAPHNGHLHDWRKRWFNFSGCAEVFSLINKVSTLID